MIVKANNAIRSFRLIPCKYKTLEPITSCIYNSKNNAMRFNSSKSNDGFYKVIDNSVDSLNMKSILNTQFVIGEVIDHAIDMRTIRPGDTIDVPYEVTISHGFRDFWQSAFYSYDR